MSERILVVLLALWPAALRGQEALQWIPWEKLRAKAVEKVEVNLDGGMIGMASRLLSGKDPDQARAKRLVGDLKGIYVRSLKFDKEGEYSMADVENLRSQLKAPEWNRVVDVQSARGGDNAGVYMKTDGNQILGIVVVAAEPKELTVVQIIGALDPERLRDLGGSFGIPKIEIEKKTAPKKDE